MNKTTHFGLIVALSMAASLLVVPAHAASFDCAKAQTRVEKFVCNDPFISKLDSQLGKVYDEDIAKANPEQKARLVAEQRHWMSFTRAACTTQTCFKHAYWSRLAELETFYMPHSPLYKHESEKAAAIKKILGTAPLYPSRLNGKECSGVFLAVKEMKGIQFVDPTIQVDSYEDPALDGFRKRVANACKKEYPQGAPITFNYQCQNSEPDIDAGSDALGFCNAYYELPPFKLYKLPPSKGKLASRYVFSFDGEYGPINIRGASLYLEHGGGFINELLPACGRGVLPQFVNGIGVDAGTLNSIVEYRHHYYFLLLYKTGSQYQLSLNPINRRDTCNWYPINIYERKK